MIISSMFFHHLLKRLVVLPPELMWSLGLCVGIGLRSFHQHLPRARRIPIAGTIHFHLEDVAPVVLVVLNKMTRTTTMMMMMMMQLLLHLIIDEHEQKEVSP